MTILITGKGGQMATCLEVAADDQEVDFLALDRQQMDLTDIESIESIINSIKPWIVINAAGFTDVLGAESADKRTLAVNSDGAGNLATVCHRHNIPIVHLSTDYVFDGEQIITYLETDYANPVNAYGISKLEGERQIIANNPQHIILRTAWIHSPFGKNFVKTMLEKAAKNHPLQVVNDQYGCPTYGPHLAHGILRVIKAVRRYEGDVFPWGIYNVTNQGITSWLNFAYEVFISSAALNGPTANIHPVLTRETTPQVIRPQNTSLNIEKFKKTFDFSLPDWKIGVSRCVTKIMRENKHYEQ